MGFSVENVLIGGRPSMALLEEWTQRALPRWTPRLGSRTVVVMASGLLDAGVSEQMTVLWLASEPGATEGASKSLTSFTPFRRLLGLERPSEWMPMKEPPGLPALPADVVGLQATNKNAFLVSLTLLAHEHGFASAFLSDSSISDAGCLYAPSGDSLLWSNADCGVQREHADNMLKGLFSDAAPDLDELQWVGPGEPFWSRSLVAADDRLG